MVRSRITAKHCSKRIRGRATKRLSDMGSVERNHSYFFSAIRKFMAMDKLTAPLFRDLIDHIIIYKTGGADKNRSHCVMIHYGFIVL